MKHGGRVLYLPSERNDIDSHRAFAENAYPVKEGDAIVVMLSAGKIGSQSVIQSLRKLPKADFPATSYHLHKFSDVSEEFTHKLKNEPRYSLPQIISGHALFCFWKKNRELFKWKFITGVRDPISQILSLQFMIRPETSIENTYDFTSKARARWPYIARYFDRVYRDIIGIDVFKYTFDKKQGYSIIKKDNVEVLLYTLENLTGIAEKAMEDFLGISNFRMIRANEAKNLPYKNQYQKTISCLEGTFMAEELEEFYSHRVVKHFYPEEKIEEFIFRWSGIGAPGIQM